jgi:cell division septum initiation protein DivIVA
MPMSASCVVNRAEILDLVDGIRDALPVALDRAESLLERKESILSEGRAQADQIIDAAYTEQERLLSETEIYRRAEIEAERILADASATADRMQGEADDYIDARLANFEVVLQKTLATVERGRSRLSGRHEQDTLPEAGEAGEAGEPADRTPEDVDEPDREPQRAADPAP